MGFKERLGRHKHDLFIYLNSVFFNSMVLFYKLGKIKERKLLSLQNTNNKQRRNKEKSAKLFVSLEIVSILFLFFHFIPTLKRSIKYFWIFFCCCIEAY